MSKKAWAVSTEDRPPQQFWIDFGNFVGASFQQEDDDGYWQTLIKWAGILMDRYNNHVANMIVRDYLDGQSRRSIENERKKE